MFSKIYDLILDYWYLVLLGYAVIAYLVVLAWACLTALWEHYYYNKAVEETVEEVMVRILKEIQKGDKKRTKEIKGRG